MARKIAFVLFTITAIAALIWLNQSPQLNLGNRQQPQPTQQLDSKATVFEQPSKPSSPKPETNHAQSPMTGKELEQINQAILNEIHNRKYSDDDFIELVSLVYQQLNCYGYPSADYLQGFSDKAAEVFTQLTQKCERDKNNYPTIAKLVEKNIDSINDLLLSTPTFKPEGEALKSLISEQNLGNQVDARTVLFTKNSQVIMHDGLIDLISGRSATLFLGNTTKDLNQPDLLLGLDDAYQKTVNGLAKALIACTYRNDQICAANSPFMVTQCFEDEKVCGLNVSQWYQKFIMPGMKKDVEIMLQYYKEIIQQ